MKNKIRNPFIASIITAMSFALLVTTNACSQLNPSKPLTEIEDVLDYIYENATDNAVKNPYRIQGTVTRRYGDMCFVQRTNEVTGKVDAIRIKGLDKYSTNVKEGDEVTIEGGNLQLVYETPTIILTKEKQVKIGKNHAVDPLKYGSVADYLENGLETSTAKGEEKYAYLRYVEIDDVETRGFYSDGYTFGDEHYKYNLFSDMFGYESDKTLMCMSFFDNAEEIVKVIEDANKEDKLFSLKGIAYWHGDRFSFLVSSINDVEVSSHYTFDEDVITSRVYANFVTGYSEDDGFYEKPLTYYYLKDKADIAYVEIGEFYEDRTNVIWGYYAFHTYRSKVEGKPHQTKYLFGRTSDESKAKGYFIVDSENDTIDCYEIDGYMMNPYSRANGMSVLALDRYDGIQIDTYSSVMYVPRSGEEHFDLGHFDIDIVQDKYGKMYAPLTVMVDTLFSTIGYGYTFNGKDLYANARVKDEGIKQRMSDESAYMDSVTRTPELAEYTYNALCYSLTYCYGLRYIREMGEPDIMFSNMGVKDLIRSANNDDYTRGIAIWAARWLYEGHAGLTKMAPIKTSEETDYGDLYVNEVKTNNQRYADIWGTLETLEGLRNEAGKKVGLEFNDNHTMAVVRFDSFVKYSQNNSFNVNVDDYTYEQLHEMGSDLLFRKAFKEIEQYDTVQDIVIDNSQNGGGHLDVVPWLEAYMTFTPNLTTRHQTQGEISELHYLVDLDNDGTYYSDGDSYQGKYNFYILNSKCSFSCGNTLPILMKANKLGKLVGERSGGGVCVVGSFSTAIGTVFRNSENRQTGYYDTTTNEFVTFENGVPADIEFGYDCYYDLDKLYAAIHQA